ncbi:MAG: Serine/threonine protein kinase PrkC, regulator of stationary phase [Candidatus Ozemobacter sibiricus]|jgi:serine/threonine-protein kinase|uniref:Serine/threonine protein kinase PrkC, regulator of stationary phase n=1 Tax=Candidatus Ozemobacter sibiricus TaxID=2268124 RepID=A0A367ZSF0_9BACT|nr:MAG: Serine/threonine protein kinase PrkC, regulator of stationary phase [Candidatus Ozemobacter sibiricus]
MAKKESCLLILVKMLILISLLIAGVVAAFFYLRGQLNEYFNRGETIEVPDFKGKHLVQVFKEKPADLVIEKADEKFDPRYPKDFVIAQYPEAGTRVKPNKKVLLTISLGSKQVNVPDLFQRNLRESRLALLNAQLLEGNLAYIRSGKVDRDRVITQSPLPAMGQAVQGKVDLLVSLGRGPVRMPLPNLTGKTLNEAQTSLTAWGLKPGRVITRKDPSRPSQTVISTVPAPFEPVGEGTTVDLLVSSGNEPGTAKAGDLERFEFTAGAAAEVTAAPAKPRDEPKPAAAAATPAAPAAPAAPQIFLADDPAPPQVVPPPPVTPPAPGAETSQISFVMPDGFMPKEVKFFQVSREGRTQVYTGTHKPLDLIKVTVPRIPSSKIQIYINDVPIEERPVQ